MIKDPTAEWLNLDECLTGDQFLKLLKQCNVILSYQDFGKLPCKPVVWNKDLVSPLNLDLGDEMNDFILKANNLYIRAMDFLLLHETGHIYYKHNVNAKGVYSIEQEKEADKYAIDTMLSDDFSAEEHLNNAYAIIIAYLAFLFIGKKDAPIVTPDHPTLQDRVRLVLEKLRDLNMDEREIVYFYHF